MNKLFSY